MASVPSVPREGTKRQRCWSELLSFCRKEGRWGADAQPQCLRGAQGRSRWLIAGIRGQVGALARFPGSGSVADGVTATPQWASREGVAATTGPVILGVCALCQAGLVGAKCEVSQRLNWDSVLHPGNSRALSQRPT